MKKNKPSKKADVKYYIERETLLTPTEAKKSGELPSKIEKITLSEKEAECFKNETLKTFLESKKQELKTFLESPEYGCIVNPSSGNNCPQGKKGKYVLLLNGSHIVPTVFRPDDFKHKRLVSIYLHQLNDIQSLFDDGKYEKAVILAFSIGEDIQRLFRMDHVLEAGTKYKSNKSRVKSSQTKRLEKSKSHREYYLDLWRKMKAENKKNSPTKINAEYFQWLDENNIEYKSKATEAKHANRWRKSAGL